MSGHDIVVISGSMGSFDAVKRLCRELPADLKAAVFIVRHVGRDSGNLLASALNGTGELPVVTATDGMPVENGRIYVAPSDHHLLLIDNVIRLGRGPRENLARPAVDALFRSAALAYGPRVIGVILSGYLNDGASGLAAVRQCGGLAVVQTPADAEADDMPLGALKACDVDYRAAAVDLPSTLCALVDQPPGPQNTPPVGLALEIEIALGRPSDTAILSRIADPVALTCPACSGVLSQMKDGPNLRFRCQVGHAYTAETLYAEQETAVDEALRVALRIVEERVTLLRRMSEDDRNHGRTRSAQTWDARLADCENDAGIIRQALMRASS